VQKLLQNTPLKHQFNKHVVWEIMYNTQKIIICHYISLMLVRNKAPLGRHDLDSMDKVYTTTIQISNFNTGNLCRIWMCNWEKTQNCSCKSLRGLTLCAHRFMAQEIQISLCVCCLCTRARVRTCTHEVAHLQEHKEIKQ